MSGVDRGGGSDSPAYRGHMTNAQRRDAARHRTAQAVELRTARHTYAQIAATLGYSNAGAAYKAVQRGLQAEEDHQSQSRKALKAEQNRSINRLIAASWSAAMRGDTKAITAARQLLERQARLNGLDEPTSIRVTDALDPEIEALLADFGIDVPGDAPPS
jgi:hypothetical protein